MTVIRTVYPLKLSARLPALPAGAGDEIVSSGIRGERRMDKALQQRIGAHEAAARKLDWRKRMSDHVAYALLVYTALQIFVTMSALKTGHGSVLPYFALVILVAAIIPACRMAEKKWERLSDREAADPGLGSAFRHDILLLWAAAIGLPFALTYGYKLAVSLI
jgi:hypothetical protein